MNTPFDALPKDGARIVYVRPISIEDLPDSLREQIGPVEIVYSVNGPDGQRLALVADRKLAAHLARAHDLSLMSVH
ncbi:MAG: DUF1150 family protein [Tabrizicola sp.]